MTLILASSSPYRRALLQRLGLAFTCQSPDIDESAKPDESPQDLAERLALEKAMHIGEQHPEALVIGSDQVAWLAGQQLHKPGTIDNNIKQLEACSGKSVHFYTGLALYKKGAFKKTCVEEYETRFRNLTRRQITHYVEQEQATQCAGGFKMEGLGIALFEYIRGDDPNTLIGLPLIQLCTMLEEAGVPIL